MAAESTTTFVDLLIGPMYPIQPPLPVAALSFALSLSLSPYGCCTTKVA